MARFRRLIVIIGFMLCCASMLFAQQADASNALEPQVTRAADVVTSGPTVEARISGEDSITTAENADVVNANSMTTESAKVSNGLETKIIKVPMDARDFLPIVRGLMRPGETVSAGGERHLVLTAGAETIASAEKVARELSEALKNSRQPATLKAVLLVSGDDMESTGAAISREETISQLERMGLAKSDLDGVRLPEKMFAVAEVSLPFNSVGRLVLPLTEKYMLRATQVEADEKTMELDVSLSKKTDAANDQMVLMHRFRATRGKAALLGVSNSRGTIVLVMTLSGAAPENSAGEQ